MEYVADLKRHHPRLKQFPVVLKKVEYGVDLSVPSAGPIMPRRGRMANGRRRGLTGAFKPGFKGSGRSIAQVSCSITTTLLTRQAVSRVGRESRESPILDGVQAARNFRGRRSGTSPVRVLPRPVVSGPMSGLPTAQGRLVTRVRSSAAPAREARPALPSYRKSCPVSCRAKSQRLRRGGRPKVNGSKVPCLRVRPSTRGAGTPVKRRGHLEGPRLARHFTTAATQTS